MDIPFTPARRLARLLHARKISVTEIMRAFVAQIERVNPKVNAIVTFLPEQALKEAKALDRRKAKKPLLAGLPIAYKDLVPTKGVRTTMGSLAFKDNVPKEDALLVERLKAAGANTLGQNNTPEYGAGSTTFNKEFGSTKKP
jgi:amidase